MLFLLAKQSELAPLAVLIGSPGTYPSMNCHLFLFVGSLSGVNIWSFQQPLCLPLVFSWSLGPVALTLEMCLRFIFVFIFWIPSLTWSFSLFSLDHRSSCYSRFCLRHSVVFTVSGVFCGEHKSQCWLQQPSVTFLSERSSTVLWPLMRWP